MTILTYFALRSAQLPEDVNAGNPGKLGFNTPTVPVREGQTLWQFPVARVGGKDGVVTVQWRIVFGTATLADLASGQVTSGTLTWADQDDSLKIISVRIALDGVAEGTEQFTILLENPSSNASLGVNTQTTAYVEDDPAGPPAVSNEIYPDYSGVTSTQVTFHPTPDTPLGVPSVVKFGMPFPASRIQPADLANCHLSISGVEQKLDLTANLMWNPPPGNTLYVSSVRSAIAYAEITFTDSNPVTATLSWDGGARTQFVNYSGTDDALKVNAARAPLVGDNTNQNLMFPASFDVDGVSTSIQEPRTWVTLPAQYMCDCRIRTTCVPVGALNSDPFWQDFDAIYEGMMGTIVDDYFNDPNQPIDLARYNQYLLVPGADTNSARWLYERDANIWQIYVRTGQLKWLIRAYRNSEYYSLHMRDEGTTGSGSFVGKVPTPTSFVDRKYSVPNGLITNTILMGDDHASKIRAIDDRQQGYITNTAFDSSTFFTERNGGYAFMSFIGRYELDGDATALANMNQVFQNFYDRQLDPAQYVQIGLTPNGALLHSLNRHEGTNPDNVTDCNGQSGDEMIGSPWMSLIIMQGVWRYYLITGNQDALRFLVNMSDWLLNEGTYTSINTSADNGSLGHEIPYYFSGPCLKTTGDSPNHLVNDESTSIFTGIEHVPEQLGAQLFGKRARQLLGLTVPQELQDRIDDHKAYIPDFYDYYTERDSAGYPDFRVTPGRKANWWYVNTTEASGLDV